MALLYKEDSECVCEEVSEGIVQRVDMCVQSMGVRRRGLGIVKVMVRALESHEHELTNEITNVGLRDMYCRKANTETLAIEIGQKYGKKTYEDEDSTPSAKQL